MRIHRIAYQRYATAPLSGEGSFLYGGRWSSVGTRMAYTSSTMTLAMIEFDAHLDTEDFDPDDPPKLVIVFAEIPEDAVITFEEFGVVLPRGWDDVPAPAVDASIGDAWIAAERSLGLIVPSVHVPSSAREMNVLLNPLHPRFAEIKPSIEEFAYDRRLLQGRRRS